MFYVLPYRRINVQGRCRILASLLLTISKKGRFASYYEKGSDGSFSQGMYGKQEISDTGYAGDEEGNRGGGL